ncbi:MAG: leucyl aminopeptidase [Alphaproteobacteria bacterium]|nr:leucyl aminopeptidase [Alphaproteobacteria bacterium]
MRIAFAGVALPKRGAVAVGVMEGRKLSPSAAQLDKRTGGAISRALAASRFSGKADQALTILAPARTQLSRLLLVGTGKADEVSADGAARRGGTIVGHLLASGESDVTVMVDPIKGAKQDDNLRAAHAGYGAKLRSYRFDKYRTKMKADDKPSLKRVTIACSNPAAAKKSFLSLDAVADAVFMTRDLVSEPGNIIYPKSLAEACKPLAELGVKVEILGVAQMKKLGMGALLGVGQGSANESQLVVMQWNGAPDAADQAPVAFIGKGVTFDTGGISIKPAGGMEDMKWDMGGAGAVIGLMRALAGRKARVNAVGIAGLVENMPSGTAQRPGDIVTSMSGQTIEVINTDAEGRLVLADAMWYCQDRFKPRFMIDLATLTGAIIISLGHEHAGLFSNNDELCQRLTDAGKAVGEPLWRMPLGDAYDRAIDSDAADMKNVGDRVGGSITAAQFIQRFVNKVPWAHLDIAGMAWSRKDTPLVPKGATAFGVRLLDRLVAEHYEEKA